MKVKINENDRYHACRAALNVISAFHEVRDREFRGNEELYELIVAAASPFLKELDDYFSAYDNWFDFWQKIRIKQGGDVGNYVLTSSEELQLTLLSTRREDTLEKLRQKFFDVTGIPTW